MHRQQEIGPDTLDNPTPLVFIGVEESGLLRRESGRLEAPSSFDALFPVLNESSGKPVGVNGISAVARASFVAVDVVTLKMSVEYESLVRSWRHAELLHEAAKLSLNLSVRESGKDHSSLLEYRDGG